MAVLRSSLFLLMAILPVSCSAMNSNFSFSYETGGCFNLIESAKEKKGEAIFLNAKVSHKDKCGCKSALFKYRAYQKVDANESELIEGYFTTLSRDSISIPVSAQEKIVYFNSPILVRFSCAVQ